MPNGVVKFFNAAKGFGFITSDESTKDIFVPATSVAAAGVSVLKTGQRVSFEMAPDKKGPKAVELKIIEPSRSPKQPKQGPAVPATHDEAQKLTVYVDPGSAAAGEVLAEIRRAGHEPVVVDYMATPPTRDELKRLSLLLRDSDQSLVRKYEHLFLELRLDDRFIGDSEYWGAIFEHPTLINGPVIVTPTRAGICHSKNAVRAFLSGPASGQVQTASKPKGLPPSLLRFVGGGATAPPAIRKASAEKAEPKTKTLAAKKARSTAMPKIASKPAAKPKSAAKTKAPPKKAARKAVKKAVGKARK